jgi:hypothetical protein
VFEKHKAKVAQEHYQAALTQWKAEHDELASALQAATTRQGSASSDIVLKAGEAVFASITNTSLVEDRRGAGHYAGHSSGFSIPVGSVGGRSVRYRVGASKGHYVQGNLHPEAVDNGKLFVTNKRVLFVGHKKTVECLFAKLVSANAGDGELALSVSNRQKVTRIHYGAKLDGWVHLRLTLAMSIGRGDSQAFAAQLQAQLNELESKRPVPVAQGA